MINKNVGNKINEKKEVDKLLKTLMITNNIKRTKKTRFTAVLGTTYNCSLIHRNVVHKYITTPVQYTILDGGGGGQRFTGIQLQYANNSLIVTNSQGTLVYRNTLCHGTQIMHYYFWEELKQTGWVHKTYIVNRGKTFVMNSTQYSSTQN